MARIPNSSPRTAILGNAGAGKSTLARRLATASQAPVLDLDGIAWNPGREAIPRNRAAVLADLDRFCTEHRTWIVEGCYGDLVAHALRHEPELILLDPGVDACVHQCQSRAWEPDKYPSKAAQDAKLSDLLEWVRAYYERDGPMSHQGHLAIYAAYEGPKRRLVGTT